MNKMPVAYIVPMGAGLDTFVYREIEALNEIGYEIILFSTKYKKGDVFGPKAEWKFRTLTPMQLVFRFPVIAFRLLLNIHIFIEAIKDNALIDFIFALDYGPAMKRYGVRQIHCHHGDHKLFIGYYCKRMNGLPLSVTIHAAEFYTNPNPGLFAKAINNCDCVFPIAQRWYDKLVDFYNVPKERIYLNRLFVDTSIYIPANVVNVISVGRFTERKGFYYLLEAAKILNDINIQFIFVGFGDLDLNKMAEELGVSDRVIVFNKMDQKQLRALYKSVDILCVPSITTEQEGAEGIPVVLMEGMACGLPVVATKCGAIDEIVEDILVDERSSIQLADAIRRLADNKELRIEQGRRNREIVIQQYSSGNVKKFASILDGLVPVR